MKWGVVLMIFGFIFVGKSSAAQTFGGFRQHQTFAQPQRAGDQFYPEKPLGQRMGKPGPSPLATGRDIHDIERTLMGMVNVDSRTPVKDLVEAIRPHLDEMHIRVQNAHNAAQQNLDTFKNQFSNCNNNQSAGNIAAQTFLADVNTKSSSHRSCRRDEGTNASTYATCSEEQEALKGIMDANCEVYRLANKVASIDSLPQPTPGEKVDTWLPRVKIYVDKEVSQLAAKKAACDNATSNYTTKKHSCEGADGSGGLKKVWQDKKSKCDQAQDALESAACTYYDKQRSTCQTYVTCATTASDLYNVQLFEAAEANRKAEWRATVRIECMLTVFGEDEQGNNVNSSKIQVCIDKRHNTSNLSLVYPVVPDPPPCVDPEHPCTPGFIDAHYGNLPSHATNKQCTPCPGNGNEVTTTTTTTPAQAYEYELQHGKDCDTVSGEDQERYVFKSGYGLNPLPPPPAWTPPSVEECEHGCDLKPDCVSFFRDEYNANCRLCKGTGPYSSERRRTGGFYERVSAQIYEYELQHGKDCDLVSGDHRVQYVFKSGYGFNPLPSPPERTPPSVEACEKGCDLKPDCVSFYRDEYNSQCSLCKGTGPYSSERRRRGGFYERVLPGE